MAAVDRHPDEILALANAIRVEGGDDLRGLRRREPLDQFLEAALAVLDPVIGVAVRREQLVFVAASASVIGAMFVAIE
jgi:hypothetical protein